MRRSGVYRRRLYYTRREKGFLYRTVVIILATSIILLLAATYTKTQIFPYIMEVSEIKTKKIIMEVVNSVIRDEFDGTPSYEDVVFVGRDSDKKIISIQTDVNRLYNLSSRIYAEIQNRINSGDAERIAIPLGALLGITLFSAEGPDIYLKVIPAAKVDIDYKSKFNNTAENQLKHNIDIDINVTIGITLPMIENKNDMTIHVPLAETVIVGNKPTILDKGY